MKYFQPLQILYTLIIFIGGIIGFLSAKSNASLIMSSLFTLFFIFTISIASKKPKISFLISFSLTTLLFFFFSFRLYQTQSIFPAGIMSLMSFLFILFHTKIFTENKLSIQ